MNKGVDKPKKEMVVSVYKEFPENPPSNFYVLNALLEYVFLHTKQRQKAQQKADELYGKGKYSIRVCGF